MSSARLRDLQCFTRYVNLSIFTNTFTVRVFEVLILAILYYQQNIMNLCDVGLEPFENQNGIEIIVKTLSKHYNIGTYDIVCG